MTRKLPPEELEGEGARLRQIAAIDAALERGEIGEDGWHHAMADLIVPAYLAGDNPRAQSGHAGDAVRWEEPGGCFSPPCTRMAPPRRGLRQRSLMECVQRRAGEEGKRLSRTASRFREPALASERLPYGGSGFSSATRSTGIRRVASTSCGRTWTRTAAATTRPSPPPARRCRRARWPTHRRPFNEEQHTPHWKRR